MSVSKLRRYRCPKCGEIYDSTHGKCPVCGVDCVMVTNPRNADRDAHHEDGDVLDDADRTFLSKARRYKNNDGVIDSAERNELVELAFVLGLDSVRREFLLERVEREYEDETTRLQRGVFSDGKDRRLAFLDWRRWRVGPFRHVRNFIGLTRNKFQSFGFERPTDDRTFGGVCSGVASRFGVNVKFSRALSIVLLVWCPYLVGVYFVFWSLMPNAGECFRG